VNTVYRKRRAPPKGASRGTKREERVPFSYTAIQSSQAIRALDLRTATSASLATTGEESAQEIPTKEAVTRSVGEIAVDFGNYPILSLELCEMGSYDEIGGYKSVGGINLLPPARP
jgi:hypothetical protein